MDLYTYNEFNQLTKLDQEQYIYEHSYDGEEERIKQVRTDTKDYHYDQWYDYSEPLDVIGNKEIKDTFTNLKQQVNKKEKNGNTCTSIVSDSYDVMYYKEDEVTEYTLDRNKEYTEILQENDIVNVYGDTLLQSNDEDIITGWNDSVVAKTNKKEIQKIAYSDYGVSKEIDKGHGYNGEMMDQTGLIYLRARYYDPSVSRFVQIDNNYDGEKENIASKNKYIYTLNNPYKYVDRDGNRSLPKRPGLAIGGAGAGALAGISGLPFGATEDYRKMNDRDFQMFLFKHPTYNRFKYTMERDRYQKNTIQGPPAPPGYKANQSTTGGGKKAPTTTSGKGQNKTSGKSGGSSTKNPTPKKVPPAPVCPKKSVLDGFLDKIQQILDWVGWIPFTIGDIADGLNALIYFLRGNVLMAIINIDCLALPAAIMAGVKQIGKACSSAVEFISKISPEAQKMVKTVTGFVTGMRDAIGKIIWLAGEKTIRPIMNKLDEFGKWVGDIYKKATGKGTSGALNALKHDLFEIGVNKIKHILQEKHLWSRLVKNIDDWSSISKIMERVLKEGIEQPYGSAFIKTLIIDGQTVQVTYQKIDGIIRISDGWIKP